MGAVSRIGSVRGGLHERQGFGGGHHERAGAGAGGRSIRYGKGEGSGQLGERAADAAVSQDRGRCEEGEASGREDGGGGRCLWELSSFSMTQGETTLSPLSQNIISRMLQM